MHLNSETSHLVFDTKSSNVLGKFDKVKPSFDMRFSIFSWYLQTHTFCGISRNALTCGGRRLAKVERPISTSEWSFLNRLKSSEIVYSRCRRLSISPCFDLACLKVGSTLDMPSFSKNDFSSS
uniref:Uncharacterized protein n=1 Tax=Cacopsylla melanoneura TaxID=428564 RepID=A0A8D8ZCI3_9HEMI